MRAGAVFVALSLISFAGTAGAFLSSRPGAYEVSSEPVRAGHRDIRATYVRPLRDQHPGQLLVFVTGDDGWFGTSAAVFAQLAEEGYMIAGVSAPEVLEPIVRSGERVGTTRAAQALKDLYTHMKRHLGLPDSTPIVIVGFSRGASVVAFTAVHPELRDGIAGAVAIALTREADYLHVPESKLGPAIQVDSQHRLQLYPALRLLGSTRLAVIQSTHDDYVPSAESRQLLGSDTPSLRLYQVEARDHGFSDALGKMLQDLDEALHWVERTVRHVE